MMEGSHYINFYDHLEAPERGFGKSHLGRLRDQIWQVCAGLVHSTAHTLWPKAQPYRIA